MSIGSLQGKSAALPMLPGKAARDVRHRPPARGLDPRGTAPEWPNGKI